MLGGRSACCAVVTESSVKKIVSEMLVIAETVMLAVVVTLARRHAEMHIVAETVVFAVVVAVAVGSAAVAVSETVDVMESPLLALEPQCSVGHAVVDVARQNSDLQATILHTTTNELSTDPLRRSES